MFKQMERFSLKLWVLGFSQPVAYRGGVWGFQTPPPKFRTFDKVESNCKLSGNSLVFLFPHPNDAMIFTTGNKPIQELIKEKVVLLHEKLLRIPVDQCWKTHEKKPRNLKTQNGYTGCNRRNGPDFGRVFLMLNYTEKPQNTYIQSSMVTEI